MINITHVAWYHRILIPVINVLFFAGVAYFSYGLLFEHFLQKGKSGVQLVIVLVTSAILTPIKSIILFFITSSNVLYQSKVLENQLYTFLSLAFVGVSASIYRIILEWFFQQNLKNEQERQRLQSELEFLKSQINPHFLFNTLNSLYALTLKKSEQSSSIVLKLSEMLRYMLYECNVNLVLLSKELNYIYNYIELEKIRYGVKPDIKFEVTGNTENQFIAPLLLMPFIENAFKHGINNQFEAGYVHIRIEVSEGSLGLEVVNSKSGELDDLTDSKSGGIGLLNVKRRLDILYPEGYLWEVENQTDFYRVDLNLRLHDINEIIK
jgi:two-component system LytT family sensor kinase